MRSEQTSPLVSFMVFAYKHERYVREAVRSALNQSYRPIEFIISDDCSPDETRRVIEDELKGYAGIHPIKLNFPEKNQGLATMVNRAFSMADGELFIVQAGDDVSEPERATRVVQAWLDAGKPDMVISNLSMIDGEGCLLKGSWHDEPLVHDDTLDQAIQNGYAAVMGCAAAYSRSIFDKYGPLERDVLQEDNVLPFRALLGSEIHAINDCLVRYRIHGGNLFLGTAHHRGGRMPREKAYQWAVNRLAIVRDNSRSFNLSGIRNSDYERRLQRHVLECQFDVMGYEVSRFSAFCLAIKALASGCSMRRAAGLLKRHFLRV
jgi:glycosyltransferase involved in cell wall biosynthesis